MNRIESTGALGHALDLRFCPVRLWLILGEGVVSVTGRFVIHTGCWNPLPCL
jgi:hypothetical protein